MTLYTSDDLAARWGISVATVNRYRRRGLLRPAGQRGLGASQYLYESAEIQRFEQNHNLIIHPPETR